ncbi:MAG: hypothetical protein WCJ85_03470 [Chitinophagaceae bacterium]
MKKAIIALCFLATQLQGSAQINKKMPSAPLVITPGVGIGALKLGMSEKAAADLLGGNLTWKSYIGEMFAFKNYGNNFAIDSIPQFVIGFDSAASFSGSLPAKWPVYSLYFKEHRLNYITVTTYGVDKALAKTVVLKNGIRFFDDMNKCIGKMKSPYLPIRYQGYDGDHIYYKEGLEFTYDGKKLTTIGVFSFAPQFLNWITRSSAAILQAYEEAEETPSED